LPQSSPLAVCAPSNTHIKESSMTKAQDNKKETKKEPAKTMKEKKEAKKVKKEERSRQ
jgi:hypothetical protein